MDYVLGFTLLCMEAPQLYQQSALVNGSQANLVLKRRKKKRKKRLNCCQPIFREVRANFSPKSKLLNFRSSDTFLLVLTRKKMANQLLRSLNWTKFLWGQEWVGFQKVPWNTWAVVAGSSVLLNVLFIHYVKSDIFLLT